jgi:hypothetical protein
LSKTIEAAKNTEIAETKLPQIKSLPALQSDQSGSATAASPDPITRDSIETALMSSSISEEFNFIKLNFKDDYEYMVGKLVSGGSVYQSSGNLEQALTTLVEQVHAKYFKDILTYADGNDLDKLTVDQIGIMNRLSKENYWACDDMFVRGYTSDISKISKETMKQMAEHTILLLTIIHDKHGNGKWEPTTNSDISTWRVAMYGERMSESEMRALTDGSAISDKLPRGVMCRIGLKMLSAAMKLGNTQRHRVLAQLYSIE